MPRVEIVGIEAIQKKLKENVTMNDVKRVVRKHGGDLQGLAQDKADFRGHYGWEKGVGRTFIPPSGKLKESIMLDLKDGGMTAEVEAKAEYSGYVELGTRFMDAQPYLKPAFNEQKEKFKKDMDKLVR